MSASSELPWDQNIQLGCDAADVGSLDVNQVMFNMWRAQREDLDNGFLIVDALAEAIQNRFSTPMPSGWQSFHSIPGTAGSSYTWIIRNTFHDSLFLVATRETKDGDRQTLDYAEYAVDFEDRTVDAVVGQAKRVNLLNDWTTDILERCVLLESFLDGVEMYRGVLNEPPSLRRSTAETGSIERWYYTADVRRCLNAVAYQLDPLIRGAYYEPGMVGSYTF